MLLPRLIIVLALTCMALHNFREYQLLSKLIAQLKAGIPMTHEKNTDLLKKRFFPNALMSLLFFLAIFSLPAYDIYSSYLDSYLPTQAVSIEEMTLPLPYVPIEEIEASQSVQYGSKKVYRRLGAILAPDQYTITQAWNHYASPIPPADMVYRPYSLEIEYYGLRFSALAVPTLSDMARHRNAVAVETPLFDGAYVRRGENMDFLFLAKNNVILEVSYQGEEDITTHLEAFVPLFDETYDFSQVP